MNIKELNELQADTVFTGISEQTWRSLRDDPPEDGSSIITLNKRGNVSEWLIDMIITVERIKNRGYEWWIPFPKMPEDK